MTAQKLEDVQHIPIASAYLCADCGAIGNRSTACAACAGASIISVACVLDRKSDTSSPLELQAA